jgi:hypothetical protein
MPKCWFAQFIAVKDFGHGTARTLRDQALFARHSVSQ